MVPFYNRLFGWGILLRRCGEFNTGADSTVHHDRRSDFPQVCHTHRPITPPKPRTFRCTQKTRQNRRFSEILSISYCIKEKTGVSSYQHMTLDNRLETTCETVVFC